MDPIEHYIAQYRNTGTGSFPDFVSDVKNKAMEQLAGTSFPSPKDEKYRYTKVAATMGQPLKISQLIKSDFSTTKVNRLLNSNIPVIDAYTIVLENGYHLSNEQIHELPGGIILGSFANAIKQFEDIYRNFYATYTPSDDILVNLNTMLSNDGYFLFVPANITSEHPIQIINLFNGQHVDTLLQPRNLVIMEPGSSADIFICDNTLSDQSFICNDVTEVMVGKDATLNMVCLQQLNMATNLTTHTIVHQQTSSHMQHHFISLSGGSVRNNLSVTLEGKNAAHVVNGLALTQGKEHTDNHINITHAAPECHSDQLFKHILSDTSTSAFTGRIVVAKDAQKTLAYQRSSNILLHPEAKMNIRPQLEIYADDVKCSHGATVGQLDGEALFYLRTRGIGEQEAKKILIQAFAAGVIDNISNESVRKEIDRLVAQKMN